jgi:hypothetical protein
MGCGTSTTFHPEQSLPRDQIFEAEDDKKVQRNNSSLEDELENHRILIEQKKTRRMTWSENPFEGKWKLVSYEVSTCRSLLRGKYLAFLLESGLIPIISSNPI